MLGIYWLKQRSETHLSMPRNELKLKDSHDNSITSQRQLFPSQGYAVSMTTCRTRWCTCCTCDERWGRSTHGLSLGNLTTYPTANCIQGLNLPFFNQLFFVLSSFDCHTFEQSSRERNQNRGAFDGLQGEKHSYSFQTSSTEVRILDSHDIY